MQNKIFIHTILISICLLYHVGYTQIDKSVAGHTIIKIMDMIEDSPKATWSNQKGESIIFGEMNSSRTYANKGIKKGRLDVSSFTPSDAIRQMIAKSMSNEVYAQTIDIGLFTVNPDDMDTITGSYRIKLPELKRIQLEVDYDVILDDPNQRDIMDFFVVINEMNQKSGGQWQKTGERHEFERQKLNELQTILEITDPLINNEKHIFTSHSYNVVLSEWAGKDVQIVLAASKKTNKSTSVKGRWVNAKLVGATFDIQFTGE